MFAVPVAVNDAQAEPVYCKEQLTITELLATNTNGTNKHGYNVIDKRDVTTLTILVDGTGSNDLILLSDSILNAYGKNGNDCIIAGAIGNDTIRGNIGNDYIYGMAGNDTIMGGQGNDYIYGGADNDTIKGQNGNDSIWGGADNDTIKGQKGNDLIYGGIGSDYLVGNKGDDIVNGDAHDTRIAGGPGEDTCTDIPTITKNNCETKVSV